MCEICEDQKKVYGGAKVGSLYMAPLAGTCGGSVVWGWWTAGENKLYESLVEAEAKARKERKTILVATLSPTEDRVNALNRAGWTKGLDYSTRYGPRKEGSLQLWFKEIRFDTNY